jgi:hypothetical protein
MVATIRAERRFLRCVFPLYFFGRSIFWPLFYFALILWGKGTRRDAGIEPKGQNPPHIAPDP